jgi:hypothetical protein
MDILALCCVKLFKKILTYYVYAPVFLKSFPCLKPKYLIFGQARSLLRNYCFVLTALSIVFSSPSFALMFAAGASYGIPQGHAFQLLNPAIGYQAGAWFESPAVMASYYLSEIRAQISYQPFPVRPLTPPNSAQLSIATSLGVTMMSGFIGIQAQAGKLGEGFVPFLGLDVGGVIDTLTYGTAAASTMNSGAAFALQAAPGFDIPVVGHLGLSVELPMRFYFFRNITMLWESTAGLRFKL